MLWKLGRLVPYHKLVKCPLPSRIKMTQNDIINFTYLSWSVLNCGLCVHSTEMITFLNLNCSKILLLISIQSEVSPSGTPLIYHHKKLNRLPSHGSFLWKHSYKEVSFFVWLECAWQNNILARGQWEASSHFTRVDKVIRSGSWLVVKKKIFTHSASIKVLISIICYLLN